MPIALSALDSGRLGIAACATGLAQAALDLAVDYATEREQFGQRDRGVPGHRSSCWPTWPPPSTPRGPCT